MHLKSEQPKTHLSDFFELEEPKKATHQVLTEMPVRRKAKKSISAARTTRSTPAQLQCASPLRRSPRILQRHKPQDPNTHVSEEPRNTPKTQRHKPSKKPSRCSKKTTVRAIIADESTKASPVSNVESFSHIRRSPRLSLLRNAKKIVDPKKGRDGESKKGSFDVGVSKCEDKKRVLDTEVNGEVGVKKSYSSSGACVEVVLRLEASQGSVRCGCARREEGFEVARKRKRGEGGDKGSVQGWTKEQEMALVGVKKSYSSSGACVEVVLGLEASQGSVRCGCARREEGFEVARKRKRGEGGDKGSVQGWTKEQEMALERAYFVSKPTPHFWKKVSKMVPGKSAQECFDKVHSDLKTPPQPKPRSRAKRTNSSPIGSFSLSASKVLRVSRLSTKRSNGSKHKIHAARRTVRKLLQKHNHINHDSGADLFSILEPNVNPSGQDSQPNVVFSTPTNAQEKHRIESSSPSHRKSLSRLSGSCGMGLVSPPVLKQVKNKALHEKYIDHLHARDARRKGVSTRGGKSITAKEKRRPINAPKVNVVRAAKDALVSDVRNAINQLKLLRANSTCNSSDLDISGVDSDDEIDNGI